MNKVKFSKARLIINLLGEVCWGIQVANFEKKFGEHKKTIELLLEKLLEEEKKDCHEIILNDSEVNIIRKALIVVEEEIEDWEFQTRIGVSLESVKMIELFQ